ncbi:MAG TPA: hypothetical protein DFS52_13480 [Myxococcales bacterium]|nr:hypothetical protein [Myxococcales bacterium]
MNGGNGHEQSTHPGGDGAAELEQRLGAQVEQVRYAVSAWNQKALSVMREYPGTCLLCAVGAGFLIGRLASRR